MANRVCEQCGGALPNRTHRQRNERGQLVCEECKRMNLPAWNTGTAHSSLNLMQQSEMRRREAEAIVSISRTARMQREGHDSGDNAILHHCFAGETEYLTFEGVKTLEETVGTLQQVLTSPQGEKTPRWVEAEIRDFGVQPLMEVTLKRNQMIKTIHATAGHRWLVGRVGQYRMVTTENLKPGHRLASLLTPGVGDLKPDHAGIRHGVIFGDGTVSGGRWARVTLWGEKDKQLLPYFPGTRQRPMVTTNGISGVSVTGGFTGEMKTVPSLDHTDEYLYGWLAGYFAADGNVNKQGQAVIDSANIDNLYAVRDVATRLGISVYSISTRWRQGYGDEPREVSRMQFVSSTLNEDFFLIEEHRNRFRFAPSRERVGWTVVGVSGTDRVEHVYCAVVPETESFVLADNIWTMNCPFCGSGAVTARSDGSTECDFCHTVFTVQVQPQHPFQPQTVDGVPSPPPGMPAGQPTEMSSPEDAAVNESQDGVAADPLGDDAQVPSNGPVAPGQPPSQQPQPPTKADPATNPGKGNDQPPWLKKKDDSGADTSKKPDDGKKKNLPPWLKKKTSLDDGWERFTFYHGTQTGWRKTTPDGRKIEIVPTNGRRGSWDVLENDQFVGETFPSPDAAKQWVDNPGGADPRFSTRTGSDDHGPVYDPKSIPPGWGAHIGDGEWVTRCPEEGCDTLIPGTLPVDIQRHLWDAHQKVAPLLPGGSRQAEKTFRTSTGAVLDAEAYMQSLALAHADDREQVLDMVRVANLQRQEAMPPFVAAEGLTHHHLKASEVKQGDFLDSGGKTRVHQTLTRNGKTTLAWRLKGSKAPGVRRHDEDEMVHVWRRS